MDAREKLLGSIEKRLTVYADWVNQGGGIRSEGAEYLYCDLLNVAFGYELKNMNRIRDNFPAIDLSDGEERLAVQVTSTGDGAKVKKTLERFYTHKLDEDYDRLIVVIAGKAECKGAKFDPPGLELQIWGTAELLQEFRDRLSMKTLKQVDAFLQERVDAPKVKEPLLHLPVPERRNPVGFLGRKAELAWIGEELKKGTKPVIVAGLGGVGKTALAVEFRKGWAGNVYFAVFRDSFTRTLAESVGMAIPVQERQGLNEEQTAALALEYLSRCEAGDLLIVDNAEVTGKKWRDLTKDPFYEKLRRLPMAVLMTTRHRDTGGKWLGRLAQEELREIFRRHEVQLSVEEMDALIDAVDGHTMTVDMIARTIRESWGDMTAEKILTAMANSTLHEGDFDEIETDHDQEQRQIYAHLRALFDLSGISDDGKYALRCATLLPQSGMDEALFRHALTDGAAKAIKLLEKKGWVDRKEGKVTIHPVVRLVCRTELKPTDEKCEDFLMRIWRQYDWSEYRYLKFAQMAGVFTEASSVMEDKDGVWANHACYLWNAVGEPQKSLACNLQYVEKNEKHQRNPSNLGEAYYYVGSIYRTQGNSEKALEFILKALRTWELRYETMDSGVANAANDLANGDLVWEDWGKVALVYDGAHPPLHGNIGICNHRGNYALNDLGEIEQACKPNRYNFLMAYNSVEHHNDTLSEYKQILDYLLRALNIQKKVLGADHPNLAASYHNIGLTYLKLENHKHSLEYMLKAREIWDRVLPGNHPFLATSSCHIAETYWAMRRVNEAATHMRRAADIINLSKLPENHRDRVNFNKWAEQMEQIARQSRGGE